jgi:hypothetical protein
VPDGGPLLGRDLDISAVCDGRVGALDEIPGLRNPEAPPAGADCRYFAGSTMHSCSDLSGPVSSLNGRVCIANARYASNEF